jgi:GT2 family glycosyltransferase
VVDNASNGGEAMVIKRECPAAHLICNEENLGFAGGTNRGIVEALALGNAPILLLNNDAMISEEATRRLLQILAEEPQVGLIGPLLFDADRPEKLLFAGGKSPIKYHNTRISSLKPGAPVRIVEYVSGTVVIIKAEVFRRVGLLDERYFFSTELADLCQRAKQQGYLSAIDTQAQAVHKVSRSSGLRDTLYVYYIVRNRFIYVRNSPSKAKAFYFIFWTLYSLTLWLKLFITGNGAGARAVGLGLKDGLQGRFGGQNERVLAACSKLTQPAP